MATEAAVVANAASSSQSANRDSGSQQQQQERRESESAVQGSTSGNNAFERMGSQRRRVVGMFKYLATEKDCIGEGGEPAECVICFEEFEQGVEMGRLECLCKFHKVCLRYGHFGLDAYVKLQRRHVYGSGGIPRAQVHAQFIRVVLHKSGVPLGGVGAFKM